MVSGYLQFYPSHSVISYISKMISKLNAINNIFLQHAVKDSRGSNNCNFSYASHTQQKTSVAANITDLSCLFQNLHGPANVANIICREKSLYSIYIFLSVRPHVFERTSERSDTKQWRSGHVDNIRVHSNHTDALTGT